VIWLVLLTVGGILIGFLVWWLIFETEGVYLGRRMVIWLYDVYATRYDRIVEVDPLQEHFHIALPLMQRLAPETDPLILDVATGTGRLPLVLLNHSGFSGYVIGMDASWRMLQQAEAKLAAVDAHEYVSLAHADGLRLPFPDSAFDVVTCLEALEFMPVPEDGLRELVRVLRPGGLLLTTLRINEPWMPGRLWSQDEMQGLLQQYGIEQIEFELWQHDYTKVWGVKNGEADFVSAARLFQ